MKAAKSKQPNFDWFLNKQKEERSPREINSAWEEALACDLNSKGLSIILYHTLYHGLKTQIYGKPEEIQRVVTNHLQGWTDQALKRKDHDSFTLGHMLTSFEMMRLRPSNRFIEFIEKEATSKLPQYSSDAMHSTLKALAALGLHFDKKFYEGVQKRMPTVQGGFSAVEIYDVFHALAITDAMGQNLHGNKRFQMGNIFGPMWGNEQVRQKLVEADMPATRRMLLDSVFWFKGQAPLPYPKEDDTASFFEKEVADAIKAAGGTILKSKIVEPSRHRIDLSAEFGQATFHVECDGPTHFVRSLDDHKIFLNGSTIFQTALMARRDPEEKLVRLPYDVFYRNLSHPEMMEYLLLEIEEAKPGSYVVGAHGSLIPLMAGYDGQLEFDDSAPRP